MIFATVGTQLPFPRLIDALNALASELGEPVLAQTGPGTPGTAWPHLECRETLSPAEFSAAFLRARVIVAHAGIGTILSARGFARPLIVVPRRHALGEHRNDHQLATARQVESLPGITVAWQPDDLRALLTGPALAAPPDPGTHTQSPAHAALVARLRDFIAA